MNELQPDDHWKPFIQRRSSLLYAAIVLGVVLIALVIRDSKQRLATEIVDAAVVSQRYEAIYDIDKWTAVRKYNMSVVPQCAWDVQKDTYEVCDEYAQICAETDSLNNCIRWRDGHCIRSHWETDYDYNVMDWADFQTYTVHDSLKVIPEEVRRLAQDIEHYKVRRRREYYYVTVRYKWKEVEFQHMPVTSSHLRVKIRKHNGNILNIE